MAKRFPRLAVGAACLALIATSVGATEFEIGGRPLSIMGYVDQGVSFGIDKSEFNTKSGLNSAVFDALLEGEYKPTSTLKVYAAGKLSADWIYPMMSNNTEWNNREFDESRDEIYLDTGWDHMLHEAHVTWSPGNLFMRAGKQIVVWGETDGFRLLDQINPVDQRHGLGDVEFESTIIPLWLLRTDYYFQPQSSWLQEIGIETVINPNARFQADRPIDLGNDVAGVWAPAVAAGAFPDGTKIHLGSSDVRDDAPDDWDKSGTAFGARIKAVIRDMIFTLNYYNGPSHAAQLKLAGAPALTMADGEPVLHIPLEYSYPRFRFAGASFTSDFPAVSASFLGGVAPVLRLEGMYGFRNTLGVQASPEMGGAPFPRYVQNNEFRYMVGVDWKIKVGFLNPKAYFFLSGQFYHRHIIGFDDSLTKPERDADMDLKDFLGNVEEDNYTTSLMINTSYFHNKLTPMFFWMRDITLNGNMYKFQVTYDYSDNWHYNVGALLLDGKDLAKGFEPLRKKDQVFATIKYRF